MSHDTPRISLPLKARAAIAVRLVGFRLRVLGMRVGVYRR
jgi:hypothetical protein